MTQGMRRGVRTVEAVWTRIRWPLAGACLAAALACSGGGGGGNGTAECDKAANVAHAQALVAAQPALAVRSKTIVTRTVTFASVADDPSVQCPVALQFKDLNGNGTLEPYEDWRLTPEERASDLLGRMDATQKVGLLAHATTTDVPTATSADVSAGLQSLITTKGVRFGIATASAASLVPRATWANAVQAACEATPLGVPFVLSMAPAHSVGNGRTKAAGFSLWPQELGFGATSDLALAEQFGQIAAQEYRAIGVRMALGPSADLDTDPRWFNGQFTFGEDAAAAGAMAAAVVKGFQGTALGPNSVACVTGHFPGAGATTGGWDARLAKGKYATYPGGNMSGQLSAFEPVLAAGTAGVMPGYGIPQTGAWTALGGILDGATIEQVGPSFSSELVGDALRGHYGFHGLVVAPRGVLEDPGVSPLGAPWGVEGLTRAQRAAKAIGAGVDQFAGLDDPAPIADARSSGSVTDAQIDAAAGRALALMFRLGLFEDPYVDAAQAPALCNTDTAYRAGLDAMNRSMVLLVNAPKPPGWLNGDGDGTQVGDKGNAGNGTGLVLPAPPGEPYVAAGCTYYIAGNFDLDYVRSVSTGYGTLTNDVSSIGGIPVTTEAEKMALSDYVFVRVDAPFTVDPDSGPLAYSLPSLEYAGNANAATLAPVAAARAALDAWNVAHPAAPSQAQIVVGVDAGRPAVVSEILAYAPSGVYYEWGVTDKVFLDVAFGIVDGRGTLPVGLPASDAAAASQLPDVAGDGQDATFVAGFGIPTDHF